MVWLRRLPVFVQCVVVGAMISGAAGALAGLVIGLYAHWQTAWFAVLELGAPSAVLGALIGAVAGVPAWLVSRRILRR